MKNIKWVAPFTQKGVTEQIKIEMKIQNKDGEYEQSFFTFDTGNTKTCISKQALHDMGYHMETYEAMKTVVSTSSLADGTRIDNGEITLKNVKIGNLFYDEFTFEIAADPYKDYNNLIGLDIIENFNPGMDFDVFEITGELRPICELRTAVDYAQTVRLLSLSEPSITELSISSNPSDLEEQQLLHYFKISGAAELVKYENGNIHLRLEPKPEIDIIAVLAKLEDNEVIEEIERKKENDIEYITYKLKQL